MDTFPRLLRGAALSLFSQRREPARPKLPARCGESRVFNSSGTPSNKSCNDEGEVVGHPWNRRFWQRSGGELCTLHSRTPALDPVRPRGISRRGNYRGFRLLIHRDKGDEIKHKAASRVHRDIKRKRHPQPYSNVYQIYHEITYKLFDNSFFIVVANDVTTWNCSSSNSHSMS